MSMVIEKKYHKSISEVSRKMGIRENDLVGRALALYLDSAKKILDVEKEFKAWDVLSDESLVGLAKRVPRRSI
ncbi:MAG: hypothetical protein HYT98_03410 [Candidatus Sungbacteria bacterium]|nr:hypothetical protein [Candidatus Sungbacteria bacterium]